MEADRGRSQPRRPGGRRKHRAVHLDDVTYAQGVAVARQRGCSFSGLVADLIAAAYRDQPTSDEEE